MATRRVKSQADGLVPSAPTDQGTIAGAAAAAQPVKAQPVAAQSVTAQPPEAKKPAMKKVTINHVTRIEGHAKITIKLDDAGRRPDAQLPVTQIRGFKKFVGARPRGKNRE